MVPVGAIVAAVIIGIRVVASLNKEQGEGSAPGAATPVSRGSNTFWNDSGAAGTIVFQLILFPVCVGALVFGLEQHDWLGFGLGVAALVLLFPWWVARRIFVPLGFARLAYATAWCSRVAWRRDKPGGPALAAAWCLAQQERPWPSSLAWVERKLTASPRALQGSGVVAWGLLEAAKGNLERAREWLDSVQHLDPRVAPDHVRELAGEWLATDAAARGDWARVKAIAGNKRWPSTRALTLLEALAGRMLGEALPTNAGLTLWWLFAPRRLWTRSFVKRALARRPGALPPPAALPEAPAGLDAPARATFLTLALHGQKAPPARAVAEVARAWEAALGGDTRSKLFARATLVGGGEPDQALADVRALVAQALGPLVPGKLDGVGEVPPLLDAAVQGRRDQLYADLEERINRLDARKREHRELPNHEEWREFLALRALYRDAVAAGGAGDRALAHSIICDKLVNFGVWLYNERLERPLANAIFRFLETEAVLVGNAEAERLNKKNAACDL